jgi:hypothetical protein
MLRLKLLGLSIAHPLIMQRRDRGFYAYTRGQSNLAELRAKLQIL